MKSVVLDTMEAENAKTLSAEYCLQYIYGDSVDT